MRSQGWPRPTRRRPATIGACTGSPRASSGLGTNRWAPIRCSLRGPTRMALRRKSAGFTLIDSLAALAITSLVVLACGALLRESGYYFDRGTRAIDETERFAWAVNRLKRDFAGARFVPEAGGKAGTAAFAGQSGKVVFVTAGREGSSGEELVEYA